ncbi:S9 family peptidase [Ramlibacter sp.]|uniref:S9 family peptidase n=1 Tax=Ramlibacter sp. TaxID=1917967 RepID=UPI003D0E8867
MKAFSVDDLRLHKRVVDLHGVETCRDAFATVRRVDEKANDYETRVWRFPVDGADAQALTQGPGNETGPRVSPDGKFLAFISDRGGSRQIHVVSLAGGEARQVGSFAHGVSEVRWSPDGKFLFAAAASMVDPDARGERSAPEPSRDQRAPEVCWKLPYKSDGVGFLLTREIHLHAVDVATGAARQLTDGSFDVLSFAPSPNGRHLAYVRTREGKFAHCCDLWTCDVDGKRHRRLTKSLSTVQRPSWSHDGTKLAFAGAIKEGDGESRLWMLASPMDEPRCVDGDMEVADADNIFWSSDDGALTLARAWHGRHQAIKLDVESGDVTILADGDRQFSAFALCGAGLVYAVDTSTQANEVFMCLEGKELRLGSINPWWSERTQLELESRDFEVPDGLGGKETIQGWLLRKKGARGPQPLLVDVHGGPASYALLDYDSNVYWQVLCSRGWTILMLNAVGSSSFGTEFCSRLSGNWGEMDLPQFLSAIEALRSDGACDERVAIVGKSYGGYLTSWAIGHTDVFEAAVVMAPVGNVETHYGTSDGGYYADPLYMRTAPEFDRGKARELSPLQFIERAHTPTLFLQGKDDERCPKCQSEELFVSLYNAGSAPCELVLYPLEGHSFLGEGKPACRMDAAGRIVDWVCKTIRTNALAKEKEASDV